MTRSVYVNKGQSIFLMRKSEQQQKAKQTEICRPFGNKRSFQIKTFKNLWFLRGKERRVFSIHTATQS